MSELVTSYRSLPIVPRVAVTGVLVLAGLLVLGSVPHLLIPVLVLGLILTGVGIVSMPFLALGVVVYAAVRAAAPRSRPAATPAPAPAGGPAAPAAVPAPAESPVQPAADLPPDLAARVARIHDKASALGAPEKAAFLSVEDRQHLDQTENEYLASALATYRALPAGSGAWGVEPEGETAVQLLERQLRLLEENLDAIARRVFQAGAAQLLAQQQFLEERFRPQPPPTDLDL